MYTINWGDLTVETFLRDYWQQKPVLIRNAFPDLEPVVSSDELAGLSLEEEVESRLIQFKPDSSEYQLECGPLNEETFAHLPESHWTLLVQAVDHYSPEAKALLDAFNFVPNWRIDDLMISYATPGGGVGPHYDNYDVFLIQAKGTRRWELGAIESSQSPRLPDAPVMILSEFQCLESFDLEPGDMLYLPPQVAHNGIATSEDCVTYSAGFRAPSDAEILRTVSDSIGEALTSEHRFSDPKRTLCQSPGEIDQASITQIEQRLKALLSNREQLESALGSLFSEPKYPDQTEQLDPEDYDDWILGATEDGIELLPNNRLLYSDGEQFKLFCNGVQLEVDDAEIELAKQLANQGYLSANQYKIGESSLIKQLFTQGAIQ
ncbi:MULTISPECIES: cupin domain-containing protein [unclassified Marinobacterium]|jgi:50S ribosomal protein L16 3-hydroxylase|uniref:cupin domain-containing protein n=1 Tax=unclassified Marinobacterium TaxID=2644139 RepID=UPI00156A56DA|nr:MULTISPECIES: cupin domain-containing protein [unclassified Marinobacterium]NRP26991.1 50S ribosomal protein L16 arginine hydroxylase [Marinobacterium sp. xm-d-420]NRP36438.1 50S ribosomal protein L16 arginine hydroxylase [Marinobacterium sp. xm-d-579]NRP57131.1 50S ribosomal protein L16 arginine hydroxylase [Marinobacterium sp. xm-d-510]NRP60456.1 50S ribosomal protein L16 arginine hydroxylase [Marinobacterium sp. xm-d-564]NRP93929.1 50S ribosomal protein L16 arginine hydroxylase [Marinoba